MTAGLYIVAFPEISGEASAWIEEQRHHHDPNSDQIAAHFTLAFGIQQMSQSELVRHAIDCVSGQAEISFSCKYVMVGDDHTASTFYAFLVPDCGFSEISRLRDALHSGRMKTSLRPDIPFIPHITLGSFHCAEDAKNFCDQLNVTGFHVDGRIKALTCVRKTGNKISIGEVAVLGGEVG